MGGDRPVHIGGRLKCLDQQAADLRVFDRRFPVDARDTRLKMLRMTK